MLSPPPAVVQEPRDVCLALTEIGLSKELVVSVARAVAAAKAEALPVDPASAPGWFAYTQGVRHIRLGLLPRGWRISRVENVESTVNDNLGIQLFYQNVDAACDPTRIPQALSGKGPAARRLVAQGQGELFAAPASAGQSKYGTRPTVWVICVAANETSLKAEVSCPTSFDGPQFDSFHKRIFVVDEFYPDLPPIMELTEDELGNIDVPVSKK